MKNENLYETNIQQKMTKRPDKINTNITKWVRGPNLNHNANGPEAQQKLKIRKIARTKWGVYSCPSLCIAENQE